MYRQCLVLQESVPRNFFFSKLIILEGVKPKKPKMVIILDIVPVATHIFCIIGISFKKISIAEKIQIRDDIEAEYRTV